MLSCVSLKEEAQLKMATCIYCDKELESLECWESGTSIFEFREHPDKPGVAGCGFLDRKDDGAPEFKCPYCKKTLFIDAAEALNFLTLKPEEACEFCKKQKGTEPIYEEDTGREIWICASCDASIEWQPANSNVMLTGGQKAGLGPAAGKPTQGTSHRSALPRRTLKGGKIEDDR